MKELEPGIDENLLNQQNADKRPCPSTPVPPRGGNPTAPYQLPGPQVEYEAAFWLVNAKLHLPTVDEIRQRLVSSGKLIPFPTDKPTLDSEIAELKKLVSKRDVEYDQIDVADLRLTPLSDFINLQNPPFGAIINGTANRTQYRVDYVKQQDSRIKRLPKTLVRTGRELARMFEIETPGLLHQHALMWHLYNRSDLSPIRHARVWTALNFTLYAALSAAWHFKWADAKNISFRQRPWEYDPTLNILFDNEVDERGDKDGPPRGCPCPSPGTPRHPAYPSGHSTYSAAASRILKYFFRDSYSVEQLDKLANNIGEARLWAGVHWRTDHTFGQSVGVAVAELIIEQLENDCVPGVPNKPCSERRNEQPPTDAELKKAEDARKKPCQDPHNHDSIPSREDVPKDSPVF